MDEPESTYEIIDVSTINLIFRAVVIYDDDGNYVLHGTSTGTVSDLFKALQPLWDYNPTKENIRYLEIPVSVPTVASEKQVRVYGTFGQ